jgi:hypothetical protein
MPNWHMKERLILSALRYQDIMPIMVGMPTVPGNNHVKPFIKALATVVSVLIIKMAWQSAELEIFSM